MATKRETTPVEDSISKVNDEIAVGSDLDFQAKSVRVERIVWILLLIFILLDVAGAFGRGPLAQAAVHASDGSIDVSYERVERFGTPSIMTIRFDRKALRDGAVQLWVSDSVIKPLGNQRVIPQPSVSEVGQGGISYTFPATTTPISVEFSLEPSEVGIWPIQLRVPGMDEVSAKVFVVP